MLSEIMCQFPAAFILFSDLFCVDGLHGKLPSHLVVFLGEGQIVGIAVMMSRQIV